METRGVLLALIAGLLVAGCAAETDTGPPALEYITAPDDPGAIPLGDPSSGIFVLAAVTPAARVSLNGP